MDWLKLFSLLVAVAVIQVHGETSKKKIRIHLPQKVKHIHHHKKIYITNHPAPSQYAPAYMPSADGVVAVPTNVAVPTVAKVLSPYNSVELYDDLPTRSATPSKLLPLYRARGHYGPPPSEWDETEDLAPSDHEDNNYVPTAFENPSPTPLLSHAPNRVKIFKIEESTKKKVPKKSNKKRVVVRNKPTVEDEHPVTTFHEKFYADLDGTGATIRKIKKPQRIEKIIDGETEHIHTYSEEHIHKLVYNDEAKLPGIIGIEPSAIAGSHPLLRIKNAPPLLINRDPLAGYSPVGSTTNLEYAAYNPREVTHDHIFHDHGEIPADVDISKDPLSYPPKYSYIGHGTRLGVGAKTHKIKHSQQYLKPTKQTQLTDYSYYGNLYTPYNRIHSLQKPSTAAQYESTRDTSEDSFRPLSYKPKEKSPWKSRNVASALHFENGKQVTDHRFHQSPYTASSPVHNYNPDLYLEQTAASAPSGSSLSNFNKDLFSYSKAENYDLDTLASTSYGSNAGKYLPKKGKLRSISTQNISFKGLDHQTTVDHLEDSDASATSISELSGPDNYNSPPSTAFTLKETSPAHSYYSAMAIKALHGDQLSEAEASNDNFQYAEPPSQSTSFSEPNTEAPVYYEITETITTLAPQPESKPRFHDINDIKESKNRYKIVTVQTVPSQTESRKSSRSNEVAQSGNKLKYGDKI